MTDTAVPTKYIPPKHRNQEADPRSNVETGLQYLDTLITERDRLEQELKEARLKINELQVELSVHHDQVAKIENRTQTVLLQRDQAVREAGELRGILTAIEAAMAAAASEPGEHGGDDE